LNFSIYLATMSCVMFLSCFPSIATLWQPPDPAIRMISILSSFTLLYFVKKC
jgi:hypothetical protein